MFESDKSRRSWKEIAMDLMAEKNNHRFTDLTMELNEALASYWSGTLTRGTLPARQIASNPCLQFGSSEWIPALLASTIDASDADFGDVQLFDPSNRSLKIVAQHGFPEEFLKFFDTVHWDDDCSCGVAMVERSRIVVTDVATDPLFQKNGSRDVMLRARAISCQSTPLIDPAGNFIGMVSTHFDHPDGPASCRWNRVDQVVAEYMAKIKLPDHGPASSPDSSGLFT